VRCHCVSSRTLPDPGPLPFSLVLRVQQEQARQAEADAALFAAGFQGVAGRAARQEPTEHAARDGCRRDTARLAGVAPGWSAGRTPLCAGPTRRMRRDAVSSEAPARLVRVIQRVRVGSTLDIVA